MILFVIKLLAKMGFITEDVKAQREESRKWVMLWLETKFKYTEDYSLAMRLAEQLSDKNIIYLERRLKAAFHRNEHMYDGIFWIGLMEGLVNEQATTK